ncbi:DUF192 domain-containing protein [Novosphingobium sp.]|uniref:DUF192 domain-containing protein n=1 Tax=Novosphingobium sp. TaxID=1874826 RepID=UPI002B46B6EB|nr:DUF192 domain-containing protein [Novosphingobium sp.]HKR91117.1 DUF192 domain-containing protein [Novosphingobium sp.]
MRLTRTFVAAVLLAPTLLPAAACSRGAPEAAGKAVARSQPALHPESGLPVIPLRIRSRGGVHTFRVEVAATDAQQEKGLMFRTKMGADEGMIFPENPPRRPAFWMKNTVIPLDIIFVGTDHRILNIAANAAPYDETPLPAAGLASGVLELNGGRAAALGIEPGDKVEW